MGRVKELINLINENTKALENLDEEYDEGYTPPVYIKRHDQLVQRQEYLVAKLCKVGKEHQIVQVEGTLVTSMPGNSNLSKKESVRMYFSGVDKDDAEGIAKFLNPTLCDITSRHIIPGMIFKR